MIAPRDPSEPEPFEVAIGDEVSGFFQPGGGLSRGWELEQGDFEARPQQAQMAAAVASAIETGKHLVAEAGTGVGKSFAYLVPAVLAALESQTRAVISTHTIALQEQLMGKDIPFLQRHLGRSFKAVLAKGRGNYLCLRRLARAEGFSGDLFPSSQMTALARLKAWAQTTADGTLQDLAEQPPHEVWSSVNVEHGNCMGHRCPEFKRCFLMQARAAMRDAAVIVVNHHLFFSDLAMRRAGGSLLPDAPVCVLDEAHQIEGAAGDHMGLRLSQYTFEHWLRRLFVPESGKGLLVALRQGEAQNMAVRVRASLDTMFEAIQEATGLSVQRSQHRLRQPLAVETAAPELIHRLCVLVRKIHDDIEGLDTRAELAAARRRGEELAVSLESFLTQSLPDQVYWLELEGARRKQIVLYSAPVEVGPVLQEDLFAKVRTVVMTSATLAVNGTLSYFKERIGAGDAEEAAFGSPFDYERQMRVFLPRAMPEPAAPEFAAASARAICRLLDLTRGSAFVLCTSVAFLRDVLARVQPHCDRMGYPVLAQGAGMPRHLMLEQFKRNVGSVLFGLDSFWQGVDVRGEALRNVIITRLPFSVPDEPLVAARMERIRERGGDPFRDFSLPEAVLKFRQGVGRLIRARGDTGIVAILDPRLQQKWYGRFFRNSLPPAAVEMFDVGTEAPAPPPDEGVAPG